jgi:threonine dehydrogenase-like Zn-dependent dehydrogenase
VAVVERNVDVLERLISHRFALERAPEAVRFAMENPTEVMKVVIGGA